MSEAYCASPYNVLFLCTGNSARSILAEAILNQLGAGRFQAYSAGSHPTGEVNPYALTLLDEHGYETQTLRSKSWHEYTSAQSPKFHLVVTVCDAAAAEQCPVWPGTPLTLHWSLPDPAAIDGDEHVKRAAFERTLATLQEHLAHLVRLSAENQNRQNFEQQLKETSNH